MRGQAEYDLDEDLDAYEEDGYGEGEDRYEDEEEEEEEQEEYEEEPPKPSKEELDYLSYRQQLKESIRRRMKKESAAHVNIKQDKNKKLPYDNFGSFFGPSQPSIARRVLEEGRSILETQHIHMKNSNSYYAGMKGPVSTTSGTKTTEREQLPVVVNPVKAKVQKLRDTRDYSFLLSDDADIPGPSNEPAYRNVPVPTSDARSAQVPSKNRPPVPNKPSATSKPSRPISNGREERKPVSSGLMNRNFPNGRNGHEERRPALNGSEERRPVPNVREERRPVPNGREERRPVSNGHEERRLIATGREEKRPVPDGREERIAVPSGREDKSFISNGREVGNSASINRSSQTKISHSKVGTAGRLDRHSTDSRKLLGGNEGNGPARVEGSKGPSPKAPSTALDKKNSVTGMKSATFGQQKSPMLKSHPQKQYAEQQRETLRHEKPKMMPKEPMSSSKPLASSSKPQMRPPRQPTGHSMQEARPKKRPVMRRYSDGEDADGASAISMIRKMFRYDPRKFQNDDEDDSDMEANFAEILREEKRSAKIGQEEDEIELRKIEEEERRERLRKEAKRRKLNH